MATSSVAPVTPPPAELAPAEKTPGELAPAELARVEFPLVRAARERYEYAEPSFADLPLARSLADRINLTRDLQNQPHLTVKAGQLAAAALLDEIFAHIIALYVRDVAPSALEAAPPYLETRLGPPATQTVYASFEALVAPSQPLASRVAATEHLLRLWLANENPAQHGFRELFDDQPLRGEPPEPTRPYGRSLAALELYFDALPHFGPENQSLLQLLLTPIRRFPDSLEMQLRFILGNWSALVEPFLTRLLVHLDYIREEDKPTFFGPGPALVPDYRVGMDEYEAFSADKDWMPRTVLLAKNTYVWLDQLSKEYGRHIYRLDQVPDEELDLLARRGFTGLWLIGVWQRSTASQRIKQHTGNPDAVASAYSLHTYDIAWELGGVEAMDNLRTRAAERGIRMASDMVPNHMAIDSQWVVEHPDWFLSLPHQPFPQASFNGPDLCSDERVSIYLEDGYYSKSDASVVFQRTDNWSGETRFVYHGNDGTHMPWNDTAQLNYLLPEVREAVIQTILHVARQFPIIRFDAAMTLAKRHYHRLWFPAPGEGGDIPSRAGRGLSGDEFDRAMPREFWREVVDRIAAQAPDTLLLAEAFWMMEGYFVRTLGMHRVYNSAFMNMLRDEENANYRQVLKNTLEFDPAILGRFVNFMNNPDEKTAVEQFGKGEKYFGVCILMSTLPGLPMFGHGQIEGYGEKYGMEYPRAYWNEQPDQGLVAHHQSVVFPLLHQRHIFAGSENFALYDFWTGEGQVNEDVFAFSNRQGSERALVIFNNRFAATSGWIKSSCGFVRKETGSRELHQAGLDQMLQLRAGPNDWSIFRDNTSGLEFLRSSQGIRDQGLYAELAPYACHVFLHWREVRDESGDYARLAILLNGSGVPDIAIALKEMLFAPFHAPFRLLIEPSLCQQLLGLKPAAPAAASTATPLPSATTAKPLPSAPADPVQEWAQRYTAFVDAVAKFLDVPRPPAAMTEAAIARLHKVMELPAVAQAPTAAPVASVTESPKVDQHVSEPVWELDEPVRLALLGWAAVADLGRLAGGKGVPQRTRLWFDDWLLGSLLESTLRATGVARARATEAIQGLRIALAHTAPADTSTNAFALLSALLADQAVQTYIGVNRWEGTLWFKAQGWARMLAWLRQVAEVQDAALPLDELDAAAQSSGWKLVKLMEAARPAPKTATAAAESTAATVAVPPSPRRQPASNQVTEPGADVTP